MRGKAITYREAKKILEANGYKLVRNSKHLIFKNDTGKTIALNSHGKRFSMKTWEREKKKLEEVDNV